MTEFLDGLAGRVAVVGSGLAGLMTALALAPRPVVLITRAGLGEETSSAWAQGGLAAAIGADDAIGLHLADTLAAGAGLCDEAAASAILARAPDLIARLEAFGVRFDRDVDGAYALGLEAAHSRRRILHAEGDSSGAAIIRPLIAAVKNTPSIAVLSGFEVRRLVMGDGKLAGLLGCHAGGAALLPTTQVVLATGGLGGLYEATTNPSGNWGQGVMLAARAGAVLADMEFVQFHPTALDGPGRPLGLVSEAVRGEGAILINERGERFMADRPGAELGPRDVVARAISAEIARGGHVFLDARPALGDRFVARFPRIDRLCRQAGIDPTRQPIPVRPAVHYHMGGVATDLSGRSSVEGLWVVGEAGATGLHGANRLASNSLLEAAVMGLNAAEDISGLPVGKARPVIDAVLPPTADPAAVRAAVSRHLSVLRDGENLCRAVNTLLPLVELEGAASDPAMVALSIAVFALLRQESRGAHARTDHPLTAPLPARQRMTFADVLDHAGAALTHPLARSA